MSSAHDVTDSPPTIPGMRTALLEEETPKGAVLLKTRGSRVRLAVRLMYHTASTFDRATNFERSILITPTRVRGTRGKHFVAGPP